MPGALLVLAATLLAAPAPARSPPAKKPAPARVLLVTSLGEIELELDLARAPITAANFLRYVEAGRYDGGRFHRTVTPDNQPDKAIKIDVIQAGVAPEHEALDWPPITLERTRDTGLRHLDGAISMARGAPDSATSDFFLCVGAQPSLDFGGGRNPDGQGFAAFGRVVRGAEVVRKIWKSPAQAQALAPPIAIVKARRLR